MIDKLTFADYVTSSILVNNEFDIKSVNNLESIKSLIFIQEEYQEITELIKNKKWEDIKNWKQDTDEKFDFLEIMKFTDQNKKLYIVTVYDSLSSWQDPQVAKIFYIS